MFRMVIGSSDDADPAQAIGDAVAQGLRALDGAPALAGILLNSGHEADSTILNAVADTWPGLVLTGCAGTAAKTPHIRLLLLSSEELDFQLCAPPPQSAHADLAAETMLADVMHHADSLALFFRPNDRRQQSQPAFEQALIRLLPDHCCDLGALLPAQQWPLAIDRYYFGRQVLFGRFPLLLARYRNGSEASWRYTRTPGILSKQQGESVWIYDTVAAERRLPAA